MNNRLKQKIQFSFDFKNMSFCLHLAAGTGEEPRSGDEESQITERSQYKRRFFAPRVYPELVEGVAHTIPVSPFGPRARRGETAFGRMT
jgi:hypothetical protein